MLFKLNLILLAAVTASALYLADLRMNIKQQTQIYGKAQELEIRLNQEHAELNYEHSRYADVALVEAAAKELDMHRPADADTVDLAVEP